MSQILTFSKDMYTATEDGQMILQNGVKLTKMALDKYYAQDPNYNTFTYSRVNEEEYGKLNALVSKAIIKYAAEKANVPQDLFDVSTQDGYKRAMGQFSAMRETVFAIQTRIIDSVNATADVEQSLLMAEVQNLADGDSGTFDVGSKSLFNVEDTSYSNNGTRYQYQFMKPVILTPRPKEASVAIDLFRMNAYGFDFGKLMAKIVMSFRVSMFDDIIKNIYDATPITGTPFYKGTFAKTTYQQLANVVAGANGSGVMAYGSNIALGKASDTISSNFAFGTSEEYVKSGMVRDLYGVPSMVLRQAVNPNDGNYSFKIPDDRLILMTPATDKPVKVVMEGETFVTLDDGRTNSINLRNFKYRQGWKTSIATQSAYGIQAV